MSLDKKIRDLDQQASEITGSINKVKNKLRWMTPWKWFSVSQFFAITTYMSFLGITSLGLGLLVAAGVISFGLIKLSGDAKAELAGLNSKLEYVRDESNEKQHKSLETFLYKGEDKKNVKTVSRAKEATVKHADTQDTLGK